MRQPLLEAYKGVVHSRAGSFLSVVILRTLLTTSHYVGLEFSSGFNFTLVRHAHPIVVTICVQFARRVVLSFSVKDFAVACRKSRNEAFEGKLSVFP
jgi:hypothetical protein